MITLKSIAAASFHVFKKPAFATIQGRNPFLNGKTKLKFVGRISQCRVGRKSGGNINEDFLGAHRVNIAGLWASARFIQGVLPKAST